jgi:large subunit ribosomal protein L18
MGKKTSEKLLSRRRRQVRVRKQISGTAERPRLAIFRSSKHIYAQIIDDVRGVTLAAASTLDAEIVSSESVKVDAARLVGELVAKRGLSASVGKVVFDRSGYIYASGPCVPSPRVLAPVACSSKGATCRLAK